MIYGTEDAHQDATMLRLPPKMAQKVFTCPAEFGDMPPSAPQNPHQSKKESIQKRIANGQLLIERDVCIMHKGRLCTKGAFGVTIDY